MRIGKQGGKRPRLRAIAAAAVLSLTLAGCMRPHETEDERLKRQTAEQTKQLREDARNAGTMAREEALKARRQAQDIVAGVKQGWQEGAGPAAAGSAEERVNLNDASEARLSELPGVSRAQARRIIRRRPYASADDLVSRGLLTEAQYDRIASRVTVH